MSRRRSVSGRACFCACVFAAAVALPCAAIADSNVPGAIAGLLPEGADPGKGSFEVMETEFGKSFGGNLQATSFPGQRPSCVFAGTPELRIEIKGDTAFEAPPMLDMAIAMYQQDIDRAPAATAGFATSFIANAPDVVSVGPVKSEALGTGHVVYVEYAEDCSGHPKGAKTRLSGFARRGATQLNFNIVVALDSAGTLQLARQIIDRFDRMDIAGLTQ
ncbi:MAG: hypothetical protein R3E82_08505 [Pseudomonadales bacterium]|nr:hypothetical protein [Pseudomonadales bacterium]